MEGGVQNQGAVFHSKAHAAGCTVGGVQVGQGVSKALGTVLTQLCIQFCQRDADLLGAVQGNGLALCVQEGHRKHLAAVGQGACPHDQPVTVGGSGGVGGGRNGIQSGSAVHLAADGADLCGLHLVQGAAGGTGHRLGVGGTAAVTDRGLGALALAGGIAVVAGVGKVVAQSGDIGHRLAGGNIAVSGGVGGFARCSAGGGLGHHGSDHGGLGHGIRAADAGDGSGCRLAGVIVKGNGHGAGVVVAQRVNRDGLAVRIIGGLLGVGVRIGVGNAVNLFACGGAGGRGGDLLRGGSLERFNVVTLAAGQGQGRTVCRVLCPSPFADVGVAGGGCRGVQQYRSFRSSCPGR